MKPLIASFLLLATTHLPAQDALIDLQDVDGKQPQSIIRNGTYSGVTLDWNFKGTAEAPIIIRAESPGGVIISGKSSLTIDGEYVTVSGLKFENAEAARKELISIRGQNNTLIDCAVIACNPKNEKTEDKWVALRGKRHRVANCTFRDKTSPDVTLTVWRADGSEDRHIIEGNHFSGRPKGNKGNGFETIRIGTSDTAMTNSRTIIRGNLFENCDGEMEIISVKSGANLIQGNTFKECAGTVTLRHGNGSRVEQNVFAGKLKKETGGVRVVGENHVIFGNAFIGTTGRAEGALALLCADKNPDPNGHQQVKNLTVEGNLFVANQGPAIVLDGEVTKRPLLPVGVVVRSNGMSGNDLQNLVRGADKATEMKLIWDKNQIFRGNQIPREIINAMPKPLVPKQVGATWLREK